MIGRYTKDAISGFLETDEGGWIKFAEDHTGSEYNIEINSATGETTLFVVTEKELEMLATIAIVTGTASAFELEQNDDELRANYFREESENQDARDKLIEKMEAAFGPSMPHDLDAAYDEAHRPLRDTYVDDPYIGRDAIVGGDGSIDEYHAVEGWGIQKLDSGDFEVTYKV